MPSAKTSTGDLVRRLGLIAPLTKQSKDWNLQPAVKKLYVEGIDTLAKRFYTLSNEDIRASRELHNAALTLLEDHAPIIWGGSVGMRNWLLTPEDERGNGLYTMHLF